MNYIVSSYQTKRRKRRYLASRKKELVLVSTPNRKTFREVTKGQVDLYKPKWSKWTELKLKYKIKSKQRTKKNLTILFFKEEKDFQLKSEDTMQKIKEGLDKVVLLTDINHSEYLVLDGNHRCSYWFGIVSKSNQNQDFTGYLGVVKTEELNKWKRWNENPKTFEVSIR